MKRKKRIGPYGKKYELKATDLIEKATLQAIQDQFSDEYAKYKVGNGLLDENADPITFERGHCAYCKAVRETEKGYLLCRKSDKVLIRAIKQFRKPYWHICEGGLIDFGAPILIDNKVITYFFWGQMRCTYCETKSNEFSRVLKRLGFGKARNGQKDSMSPGLLREYRQVKIKKQTEIEKVAKGGLDFAKKLNAVLNKLVAWEKPYEVDEFVTKIVREYDLNALFTLCIKEIPRLLDTRGCSIFTVVKRSAKAEPRLVLQKTSFPESNNKEGRGSYSKGQGLTGWVWENRCALRLADITDENEIGRYHCLEWTHTINDSDIHKEWLGVPLFARNKKVIGVIRVPAKNKVGRSSGGGFDFRDELRLMRIGQAIANEIEVLEQRERTLSALKISQECDIKLCLVETQAAIAKIVVNACAKIFGEDGKAYFFNIFNREDRKLTTQEIKGTLTDEWMKGKELPKSSLSSKCIENKKEMIIHNVPKALKDGCYYELAKETECAMSIPILFGKEVFGTISMGADRRYEFKEEPDLHILRDIASITAATFARLDAEQMAQLNLREMVLGITHTLANRIPTLTNWLNLLEKKTGNQNKVEISRLREGINFIIGAIDTGKYFGRMSRPLQMRSFDLTPILYRLKRLYSGEHIHWKIQKTLQMLGDPAIIEQVTVELIANSLRFINKQTGEIKVGVYRHNIKLAAKHTRIAVIIRVDNNGPGIATNKKRDIFKPTETADPASHFGLGLSFVQNVAQRHGGYAEECGDEKTGVSFRVVFPQ